MHTLLFIFSRSWLPIAGFALILAISFGRAHGADSEIPDRPFEIPAGDAATTLSLFAQQASLPVVYLVADVRGEKTSAIKGNYDSRAALEMMLQGSNLAASYDQESKALMVTRHKHATPSVEKSTKKIPPEP